MKYPDYPYDELLKLFDRAVIQRAKSIVYSGDVLIDEHNQDEFVISAEVRSQSRNVFYNVEIYNPDDPESTEFICNCPYGEGCKHSAAVLIFMNKQREKQSQASSADMTKTVTNQTASSKKSATKPVNALEPASTNNRNEKNELFGAPIPEITPAWIDQYSDKKNAEKAQDILWALYNTKFREKNQTTSVFTIRNSGIQTIETEYKLVKNEILEIRCSCENIGNQRLCEHAHAGLLYIKKYYGTNYFLFRSKTDELKTQLLQEYGYTIHNYPKNVFTFSIERNKLQLYCDDPSYRKLSELTTIETGLIDPEQGLENFSTRKKRNGKTEPADEESLAVIVRCSEENFPYYHFSLISGRYSEKTQMFEGKLSSYHLLDPSARNLNFPDEELLELLIRAQSAHMHFLSGQLQLYYDHGNYDPNKKISRQRLGEISPAIFSTLRELMPKLKNYPLVLYPKTDPKDYRTKYFHAAIHETPLPFKIFFRETKEYGEIIAGYPSPVQNNMAIIQKDKTVFLYQFDSDIYYVKPYEQNDLISRFHDTPVIRFPLSAKNQILLNFLLPLKEKYDVVLPNDIQIESIEQDPQPEVYLSEHKDKYLLIRPVVRYGSIFVTRLMKGERVIFENDGRFFSAERSEDKEKAFFDLIETLHPDFPEQHQDAFFLSFSDALAGNWFFSAYHRLSENNIAVFGQHKLKHFRYNTNKPTLNFNCSSGFDWFDLKVELQYGDQSVSFKDFRKALIKKQQFVVLDDGTLGVMPEEWIQKYSTLFRLGEVEEDHLRLSKLHVTLLDEVHEDLRDQDVLKEIEEKRRALLSFEKIQTVPVPRGINAILRHYQESGLSWLHFLEESQWGGILADDMGLGKTLQAIAFLKLIIERQPESRHLIVVPNTLIFNWENELQKFAPDLTYTIHHGTARDKAIDENLKTSLLITSYGTLRQDIESLLKISFYYVILDEGQAIRNRTTLTNKAAHALRCKNRLVLSGTPVQNNTMDLYSLMNFVNPSYLGGSDFFRDEFAAPIDKQQDKTKVERLKKLCYPFILRRTKEQVAADLPDKTETIIYCEMESEQRRAYNDCRIEFRDRIMKKMSKEGLAKTGFLILEGLMKLRQICDSPDLVDQYADVKDASIKLSEIVRELDENLSDHKALVFSNFLGMLVLVKEELRARKIKFEYLDGQTKNRKACVERFQNDPDVRVFLISIMAGGLGVNLTAADYVYILDPWWNPAVEQQAIDRTHRIGQDKKIFAYKMICKDTIEEKILQLQQRKKSLTQDLISDDNAFLKALKKEDIEYLFG